MIAPYCIRPDAVLVIVLAFSMQVVRILDNTSYAYIDPIIPEKRLYCVYIIRETFLGVLSSFSRGFSWNLRLNYAIFLKDAALSCKCSLMLP